MEKKHKNIDVIFKINKVSTILHMPKIIIDVIIKIRKLTRTYDKYYNKGMT
jgi:hypothetical protein